MNQNLTNIILSRLQEAFNPSHLEVHDESESHRGHSGYQQGGRHFAIIITADAFKNLSKIESHRLIYNQFQDLMPIPLHALRIKIKQ